MLRFVLIGAALVALTVIIHALGTTSILRMLGKRLADPQYLSGRSGTLRVLVGTTTLLLALHVIEIFIWALAYLLMLPPGEVTSFEESVYYSFVTFTTLGYGDITLNGVWRILSGIEALNGILLVGWSTAMLFAVVQRIWQAAPKKGATE